MRRATSWALLRRSIALGLIVAGGAFAAQASDTIKIGASISLSGALSREGGFLQQGYELWKQKANDEGGILVGGKRHKIEIIYYDDESKAQTSAQLTEKLISEDKVDFLFGPYSSGIGTATTAIAEKYKMLTMSPMTTANSIYARGFKYVFCPSPLADSGLYSVLDMAAKLKPAPKTIAIVGPDDLFPNVTAGGAKKKAKDLHIDVVYEAKYPKASPDLSAVSTALRDKSPDMVVSTGYTQDSILLVKSMQEMKIKPKLVGFATAIAIPDFRGTLGPAAENLVGAEYWVRTQTYSGRYFKSSEEYYQAFNSAFKRPPIQHAAAGTAGAIILQLAIEKANSLKAEDVRRALLSLEGETFYGRFKFTDAGTNPLATLAVLQIRGGEPKVVYPEVIKQLDVTYPLP